MVPEYSRSTGMTIDLRPDEDGLTMDHLLYPGSAAFTTKPAALVATKGGRRRDATGGVDDDDAGQIDHNTGVSVDHLREDELGQDHWSHHVGLEVTIDQAGASASPPATGRWDALVPGGPLTWSTLVVRIWLDDDGHHCDG